MIPLEALDSPQELKAPFESSRHYFSGSSLRISAFTLIELLVVIAIIGTVSTLGVAGYRGIKESAGATQQIMAGKSLFAASARYSSEHNGLLLQGYIEKAPRQMNPVSGRQISGLAMTRYPFRLAPYFDYNMEGVIYNAKIRRQIESKVGSFNSSNADYQISLTPMFGMNYRYVGGEATIIAGQVFAQGMENEIVTRQAQIDHRLIMFATARYTTDGEIGFHRIDAPTVLDNGRAVRWGSAAWSKNESPQSFGYLDPRFNEKILCVFTDGSIAQHTIEELRDMRLWSINAARADDPNYVPSAE